MTLLHNFTQNNLTLYEDKAVLYFQLGWSYDNEDVDVPGNTWPPPPAGHKTKRADSSSSSGTTTTYSYSPPWAVAADEQAAQALLGDNPALGRPLEAYRDECPTPAVPPSSSSSSPAGTDASPSSAATGKSSTAAVSTGRPSSQGKQGLSTGAVAGIVVGAVVFLLLLLCVGAGCLCRRRKQQQQRRGGDHDHQHRGVHKSSSSNTMQDLAVAEKEARAVMMETATPDTPLCSERDNQQLQLRHQHSSLSLGERGLDLGDLETSTNNHHSSGIGTAIATTTRPTGGGDDVGDSSPDQHHQMHHDDEEESDENAELEHTSMMGSPVHHHNPHPSQDRSFFTPYTDRPAPTDDDYYSQHHRVVDGADLVQQEQSNSSSNKSVSQAAKSSSPGGGTAGGNRHTEQLPPQRSSISRRSSGSSSANHPDNHDTDNSTARARARSTTPSGISGRYAHLVEDGMTDDEIRRLEEEERALDEAIEQATGTTTTGRAAAPR